VSVRGVTSTITATGLSQTAQVLFRLSGANLQSTSDQLFTKFYSGSAYFVTQIIARQRSGAASIACAGGIYDAAAKGGNALVAAAQSWVTLASGVIVSATLATLVGTTLLSNIPRLSLTTGSTAACTADFYILGLDIS
jgi:hypothetical protein